MQYTPLKCFLGYSRTKKRLSRLQKQEVQKFKKLKFFQNPRFWSKNSHFSNFFVLGNIDKEKFFYDILEQKKNPSQAIKTRSSKSRKTNIFPNGVTHGFGQEIAIFPTLFLGNIVQENVFYDILERKNASLGYKKMKFKKSENLHFSKEVNPWFWSKNGHFSNFFFLGNIGQEKFFSIFLNKKMPFQAIKTRSSKSRITDNFPRGLTHGFGQKMAIFPTFFYSIQARKSSFRIFQNEKKPFLGYENKKLKKSEN